ncbi:MAG TPA: hypothetical protein VND66_09500 [Acidobacteriaceae bacterium]|nr:hypothetical protein [Acidobacteriaceae bacterium]
MLQRALVIQGVAVLALLMPPGIAAQLPDAPSPAQVVEKARPSTAADLSYDGFHFDSALESAQIREPAAQETPNAVPRVTEVSSSTANPEQIAAWMEPAAEGFARPVTRKTMRPELPPNDATLQAIPGSAPALYNPCPKDACAVAEAKMCCRQQVSSPFEKYLNEPGVVPLTARDNLRSAVRGIIDPFNLLTIGGDSAIGVASDSHSPYGPGMEGFAKYAGVSMTEDITGEFFGTFLVPSLVHQDAHYHREPFLPIKRRILHAIVQIVWTQSYTGRPMFNYANFVGGAATAAVSNTFVPGPNRQGFGSTAQRLALAFAISPSGNLIEEFVPDLASHINLRIVIFQRILNSVTLEESGVMQ